MKPENPCVVIGGGEEDKIPALVTEFSIKSRSLVDVEVIQTYNKDRPMFKCNSSATLFSLVRWWVPELRNFKGRAIYLDSDMVILDDICKIFNLPMNNCAILHTPDPSVMLIDCEHEGIKHWDAWDIRDTIDAGLMRYRNMMESINYTSPEHIGTLDAVWNHCDIYEEGITKNLHYTNLHLQPWRVRKEHPYEKIWTKELLDAIKYGLIREEELPASPFYEYILTLVKRYKR